MIANAEKELAPKAKVTNSYKQVELEVTVETNGDEHIEQITTALEQHNFIIQKIY